MDPSYVQLQWAKRAVSAVERLNKDRPQDVKEHLAAIMHGELSQERQEALIELLEKSADQLEKYGPKFYLIEED